MIVKIGNGVDRNFRKDINRGYKFGVLSYKQPTALQKSVRRFSDYLFSPEWELCALLHLNGEAFFTICDTITTNGIRLLSLTNP